MGLRWDAAQQRRFALAADGVAAGRPGDPAPGVAVGYQLYLWDMRARARHGKRIV